MSDTARLEFVKITVADLDAATAFYATALQQIQTARFELGEGEDALEEVIMGPQGGAGQNVVLVQYKTPRVADAGSTVLGFGVTGIKTVLQRVKRAGGSVVTPPKLVAACGSRLPSSRIRRVTGSSSSSGTRSLTTSECQPQTCSREWENRQSPGRLRPSVAPSRGKERRCLTCQGTSHLSQVLGATREPVSSARSPCRGPRSP